MIVSPNEDDVFLALVSFLKGILPLVSTGPDVKFVVVAGQDNRVAEPKGSDYIVFWPLRMPRLSTTVEKMFDLGLQSSYEQSSQCVIQLDVHGPNSFDNSSIISTLFRSSYAVDFFAALGDTIAPLFADDPRQAPFISGEQQYEDRYIIEANLQVNQTITMPALSARTLSLDITDADADPASWPNANVTVVAT